MAEQAKRLKWDQTGERYYETGVKNAVLYVMNGSTYGTGVAWNGITSISESPSGADENALYADDMKYLSLRAKEDFGATVEAYTYPDEWAECDGSASPIAGMTLGQQSRKTFGLCYRTTIGNDTENDNYGYKLHIIYNATAAPSDRQYQTINDSPEAISFSWELNTIAIDPEIEGMKPTAFITIDSTKVNDEAKMKALEDVLYGVDGTSDPRLPLPKEIFTILGGVAA